MDLFWQAHEKKNAFSSNVDGHDTLLGWSECFDDVVKWSSSTSIQRFPLTVSDIGSIRNTALYFQGCSAYSLCLPWVVLTWSCLTVWQILQLSLFFPINDVIPGHFQLCWSWLVILATPKCVKACVFLITFPLSNNGHTAHHQCLFWEATLASSTPSGQRHNESFSQCSLFSSDWPSFCSSFITSTLFCRVRYLSATTLVQ